MSMNATDNSSSYCPTVKDAPDVWIPVVDTLLGAVFAIISVWVILSNGFIVSFHLKRSQNLVGNTFILFQIAFDDLIGGFIGIIYCYNLLSGRSNTLFNGFLGDVFLCQLYGVFRNLIYIMAPVLLAHATAFRVIAVIWPFRYRKIVYGYKKVEVVLCLMAWIHGIFLGLFPFIAGSRMCFSVISGACDYRTIRVFQGDKRATTLYLLALSVLPSNISYFIIVVGGGIVIVKLLKQHRKTSAISERIKDHVHLNESRRPSVSADRSPYQRERQSTSLKLKARRWMSLGEVRRKRKELIIIRCTLALSGSYLLAHFIPITYNTVFLFKFTDTFTAISDGDNTGEAYVQVWYYLSPIVTGIIDGIVQIICNKDMKRIISQYKRSVSRQTRSSAETRPDAVTVYKSGSLVCQSQRSVAIEVAEFHAPPGSSGSRDELHLVRSRHSNVVPPHHVTKARALRRVSASNKDG